MLVVVSGGRPPLVFNLTQRPRLEPGQAIEWVFTSGTHRVSVGPAEEIVVQFRGTTDALQAFDRMMEQSGSVPVRVTARLGDAGAPRSHAPARRTEPGESAVPLSGNLGVMTANPALAALYLDFLARFAGRRVPREAARDGLTREQITTLIANSPEAVAVTQYFTQGWVEYRAAGGGPVAPFGILEEALLNQRAHSNFTVQHNRLEIKNAPQGWGLYLRGTPLRYYDEDGQPVLGAHGAMRDPGYRAFAPPRLAVRITIRDPALLGLLRAIQQTGVDQPMQVYEAAMGYVHNADLLWPAVRDGWDAGDVVLAKFREQAVVLVLFLGAHLAAEFMKRAGDPRVRILGIAISAAVVAVGRALQLVFVGGLALLGYDCGRELSLIHRRENEPLDELSQRHLQRAAVLMREILTDLAALGLTAAGVQVARTIVTVMPPPGGPTPAFATAGAGGAPGPVVRAPAAAVAGPPPSMPPLVPAPPTLRREGEGGEEPERGRPETGREFEERMRRDFEARRPPDSPEYFGRAQKSFSQLVRELRTHIRLLVRQGLADPAPGLDDAPLSQNTHDFINRNQRLAAWWERRSLHLAEQLQRIQRQLTAAAGDQSRIAELQRYKRATEAEIDEMRSLEQGNIGDKRADIVEMFLQEQRSVITDTTLRPYDELHNFKTDLYVGILKALTKWQDTFGVEFRSVYEQQVRP